MTMDFTLDEEITLIKKQLLRRPTTGVMEGCNKACSGGEVRRVNVIYYLSINGKIQHPHLIRVRIHYNGVRLRDVKRWFSDLRGKDMPDSFAWSYKRRYKMGYVWQDLMDDDLITPICDNEYVLMGSQLPCSPYPSSTLDASSCGEKTPKRDVEFKVAAAAADEAKQPPTVDTPMEMDEGVPPRPPLQLEDGPPETNRCSEDPTGAVKIDTPSLQEEEVQKQGEKQEGSLEREKGRKSGGRRSRSASRMVRGIIACGMGEANGTPLLPVSRRERVRGRQSFSPLHCITRMIPICLRGPGNL